MRETRYYQVAGHRFGVSGEAEVFAQMENYEPFRFSPESGEAGLNTLVFVLAVGKDEKPGYTEELRQEDEGQVIVCGHSATGEAVFEFQWAGVTAGWLVCSADYREGRLITTGRHAKMAIDNALMVLFALATAGESTVLFHAAVVSHGDRAYMFLGPSGTGKSTHARLRLKYIEGTSLLDNLAAVYTLYILCIGHIHSDEIVQGRLDYKSCCLSLCHGNSVSLFPF